ncbi:transcription activator Tec1p [[Candida] jaroonii]|uniref:Transcription activator Tec1p n=1 Tax=[Candida] jaroonii TaxID=467808 RepID=A0ACA9YB80_9ASCO|nr:transcription activator Tec1p [[Candida] jaroonii]
MSHTPITPMTKNKKLPMIVDIAIDDNGKQLYQIHESSKFVRKEMPKSTKFYQNQELVDEDFQDKTPIRKILGTISPSTLNKKSSDDEDDHYENFENFQQGDLKTEIKDDFLNYQFDSHGDSSLPVSIPQSVPLPGSLPNSLPGSLPGSLPNSLSGSLSAPTYNEEFRERSHSHPMIKEDLSKSHDIWSDEVEQAFEEVLSIIPKNGLNKIKISGRSCGRNELISDYILTKTGKFRTRKQVSSHIQVIKNLGQKHHIIKLINEGPTFNNESDQVENMKKFEEIFSKINLNKSLGLNKKRQFNELNHILKKPKKNSFSASNHEFSVENFYMSVYDNLLTNPIILSLQNNQEIKSLKLKPNANISNRFPDLNDFKQFPIIHNLVKLNLPNLPINYTIENGLKTNFSIKCQNEAIKEVSVFTIIYNYGKEFFKINENNVQINGNNNFILKFWKYFFNNEILNNSNNLNHLTIKQIIYENTNTNSTNSLKLPKSKINTIFLWEFLKVNDLKDAITTTSKLTLPDEITAQEVQYYENSNEINPLNPQSLQAPLQSSIPSMPQSTLSAVPSSSTTMNYLPEMEEDFYDKKLSKPQLIQKKFQALQNEYEYYPYYYNGQPQPQPVPESHHLHSQIPNPQTIQPISHQQHAGQAAGQPMVDYDYQLFYDPNYLEY